MTELTDEQMRALTAQAGSKSAKIRALDRHGVSKSAIANFLKIKYQFVYNVLARDAPKFEADAKAAATDGQRAAAPEFFQVEIDCEGRIRLPAEYVDAERLRGGDALFCRRDGDGIRIMSQAAALRYLGDLVKRHMPDHVSLIDALLTKGKANSTGSP